MNTKCYFQTSPCQHSTRENNSSFKLVSPMKGEQYLGRKYKNHSLVFVLEGEVEFSYNDYLYHHFLKGELFFIPQTAEMHGIALADSKLLVLTFDNRLKSICDNCCRLSYMKQNKESQYEFVSLKLTEAMLLFAELMESYIKNEHTCTFLDEIKRKELFILMSVDYTQEELLKLFYPITECNTDFKANVLEHYKYGISLQNLAQILGMSYSSFSKKFKLEFEEPVQEWMLKQKAKHIKLRLSVPTITHADIIQDFGFTDAPHFNKFCRKRFGCTPNELMQEVRKKGNVKLNDTPFI